MKYRVEHDSLGTVQVPEPALYGAQTMRAVINFPVSGRTAHASLIRAYLRIKRSAAVANGQVGTLDSEQVKLIISACDEILGMPISQWPETFPVDPYQAGAGTSQNMNANEVIANVANRLAGKKLGDYAPIHPNDQVNRSQSTNDTFPTAMRLALLENSQELLFQVTQTQQSLALKAQAWMHLPKSARTHLQDAVPITLGQEFNAYASTLKRLGRWIGLARYELMELGIGGSAAGTGLTVPPGFREAIVTELSQLTGEELRSAPDLFEAMQSQAPIGYYASTLRLLALELTRICNDLRLMASGPLTGLSEILLPAVQPGSSIMPGKVNPSIIEMANQAWFSVLGLEQTFAFCLQAGQLDLNVMMPMMAYSTLEATQITARTLEILRLKCIDGLKPNEPNLLKYFESTPQVATALSPNLGYEETAKLVSEAIASGRSVIELVRARKLIPEAELSALLNVEALTGVKPN